MNLSLRIGGDTLTEIHLDLELEDQGEHTCEHTWALLHRQINFRQIDDRQIDDRQIDDVDARIARLTEARRAPVDIAEPHH